MENSVLQQMHDKVICSDLQGIKYSTEQNQDDSLSHITTPIGRPMWLSVGISKFGSPVGQTVTHHSNMIMQFDS